MLHAVGRAGTAADPLRAIAAGVRAALRLPYVRLSIHNGPSVEVGRAPAIFRVYALRYRGRDIGALRARPGSPRTHERLLALADHVAVLVRAARADGELAAARARIVAAREAERRTLRRDLHDGLGAAMAAMGLALAAARRGTDAVDPLPALEEGLAECRTALRTALDGLRPPQLDAGLVPAVAGAADRLTRAGLAVRVEAPAHLPPVAPAVAVAAYRIAGEALTNVATHSAAGTCTVRLVAGERLTLEVADAGRPVAGERLTLEVADAGRRTPGNAVPGEGRLGLGSMRERAAEVGGDVSVRSGPGRGTVVRAVLPWNGA